MKTPFFLLAALCVLTLPAFGQDSTSLYQKVLSFPDKLFSAIDGKASKVEQGLDKQTSKYLNKLAKQENKLKRKLLKKDPLLAQSLFPANIDSSYKALKAKASNITNAATSYSSVYSGHLDSLSTALTFLKVSNASLAANPEITKALNQYRSLQDKLNGTHQIQEYLTKRKQLLKEHLERLGMVKQYRQFQRQVYYYKAQVEEYKAAFEDPSKLEQKLMEVAMKVPQFKDFFASHSELGQLFALPSNGSGGRAASLQGLQTRAMLEQSLAQRFGSGASVTQLLQQNVQAGQGQLQALKDKVSQYSSGTVGNSNSDLEQPDFKPNQQKTKSFLKRLEYGSIIQSQPVKSIFPVTTDIGLSVGYKLNDKSIIGIGGSYKVGWGSGFNDIHITHEGVGVRSFMDLKLKGSFYVSGGYEQNYRSRIHAFEQLKQYSGWQSSGLIGVSKKYQVSKKLKGNMQLLWDFLSYQQIPRTQAVLFRIGYAFK